MYSCYIFEYFESKLSAKFDVDFRKETAQKTLNNVSYGNMNDARCHQL